MRELDLTAVAGARQAGLAELLRQRLVKGFVVPNPGAGAEVSVTVPGAVTWELLNVVGRLTASAVVANRITSVAVNDAAGNLVQRWYSNRTLTASGGALYNWSAGYGDHLANSGTNDSIPTPPPLLLPGWTVGTSTAALDAGDAWTLIYMKVREWSVSEVDAQAEWLAARVGR